MSERPNIYEPSDIQTREELEGYTAHRVGVGAQAGGERLGMSLWILPPGQAAYPYHFHLVEEEMLVVLEGTPTLRTPEGTRVLDRGEVVSFAANAEGAHQLLNDTGTEARFLSISTVDATDICVYPDTNKISAGERRVGGGGVRHIFRIEDAVGYYDGMEPR